MPLTYSLISTGTLSGGSASYIEFTSIPSTYTDLLIKVSARTNRASIVDAISLTFNGDTTTTNYKFAYIWAVSGNSTSAIYNTYFEELAYVNGNNANANSFGHTTFTINEYAGNKTKHVISNSGCMSQDTGSPRRNFGGFHWNSTAAISTIRILPITGSQLQQYSSATLYGRKRA